MASITPDKWIGDADTRAYLYNIASVVGGAAVTFGVVTQDQVGAILGIIGAILMVGGLQLARANKGQKIPEVVAEAAAEAPKLTEPDAVQEDPRTLESEVAHFAELRRQARQTQIDRDATN